MSACAMSPDGTYVVTASTDETVRIWDRAAEQTLRLFEGHGGAVNACAVSPDSAIVLSGSDDQQRSSGHAEE